MNSIPQLHIRTARIAALRLWGTASSSQLVTQKARNYQYELPIDIFAFLQTGSVVANGHVFFDQNQEILSMTLERGPLTGGWPLAQLQSSFSC